MTLTLVGSNYICGHRLEASPGVAVRGTSSLTINGKGTLNAVGAGTGRQPCILGEPNTTISIAGGTVLAHSGVTGGNALLQASSLFPEALSKRSVVEWSAAITASKSIAVSGRSVTAKGSKFVAGIGSDHYGSCGSITISGGIVNARRRPVCSHRLASAARAKSRSAGAPSTPSAGWALMGRPGRGYHNSSSRHHRRDGKMQRGGFNEGGVWRRHQLRRLRQR
ncbi:MAG: hypothetical protein ACLTMP_08325 [Eggerthella lenta]